MGAGGCQVVRSGAGYSLETQSSHCRIESIIGCPKEAKKDTSFIDFRATSKHRLCEIQIIL